jgi:hypothetical protein
MPLLAAIKIDHPIMVSLDVSAAKFLVLNSMNVVLSSVVKSPREEMDTYTSIPTQYAYGIPVSNRSDGFDLIGIIGLFEKVAVELNEGFLTEVYDSNTKEMMGVIPISPIEVSQ